MEKGKPAIPREPATKEQDKPAPSMRGALVLIFITLALLLAIYILSLLGSGTSHRTPPNQQPQEQNWTLSPLVAQYDPMKTTPVIVIDCKYMRVGSNVLSAGDETEREIIGEALCTATNSSTFCSKFGRTVLTTLNSPECKSRNKILIYAFHSPSCAISSEQRNVLDAFRDEFKSDVAVEYICTPRGDQDLSQCAYQFSIGKYDK
jgi:hypothetical protein